MNSLAANQPPGHEGLDQRIAGLFQDLRGFSERVAPLNPRRGMQSDNFDRYQLRYEEGVGPVWADVALHRDEMTITYRDLENDDPENVIKLQYPVPGGGTVNEDDSHRSRLTTVIRRTPEGMKMTTVERLLHSSDGTVQVLNQWENDPFDVERLGLFLRDVPDRIIQNNILNRRLGATVRNLASVALERLVSGFNKIYRPYG